MTNLTLSEQFSELLADLRHSLVIVQAKRFSAGAGIIWGEQNLLLTNSHVLGRNKSALVTFSNDKQVQAATTDMLIFDIEELISFISGVMTLLPGDVIATGTPSGIGPMEPGDKVEIRIENGGSLINSVEK